MYTPIHYYFATLNLTIKKTEICIDRKEVIFSVIYIYVKMLDQSQETQVIAPALPLSCMMLGLHITISASSMKGEYQGPSQNKI